MNIDGFVVIPPLNPWDEKNRDKIIPALAYRTFGITATEAWAKHTQKQPSDNEFSSIIQRSHDRGYRLKEATLIIKNNVEVE